MAPSHSQQLSQEQVRQQTDGATTVQELNVPDTETLAPLTLPQPQISDGAEMQSQHTVTPMQADTLALQQVPPDEGQHLGHEGGPHLHNMLGTSSHNTKSRRYGC